MRQAPFTLALICVLALAAAGCGSARSAPDLAVATAPAVDPTPETLIPAGEFAMGVEGEGSSSPPPGVLEFQRQPAQF
jgi:hypothetical protein